MRKKGNNAILISGKLCSGKTTLGNGIMEIDPRYQRMPLAQALKRDVEFLSQKHITSENKHLFRPVLQSYGALMRGLHGEDYWVDRMVADCIVGEMRHVIVDDVRYPNEVAALRRAFDNTLLVRLAIPPAVQSERYISIYGTEPTVEILTHHSETSLDDFDDFDKYMRADMPADVVLSELVDYIGRSKLVDFVDTTHWSPKKLERVA